MRSHRFAVLGLAFPAFLLVACGSSSSTPPPTPVRTASVTVSSSLSSGSPSPSPSVAATTSVPVTRVTESNPPGDIPDNQVFIPYRPTGGGYTIKVPEGWSRISAGGGVIFTDKLNHVEVSSAAQASAPTPASIAVTDAQLLSRTVPAFTAGRATTVTLSGGSAVLFRYQGDSAPDEVTGKVIRDAFERYTFFRNGVRVDLTLSGPTNADNVDPWRIVSHSFRWVR